METKEKKEPIEQVLEEIKILKKEVFYNRVLLGIFLIFSLLYVHFQMTNLGDIIGMLVQIFMPN